MAGVESGHAEQDDAAARQAAEVAVELSEAEGRAGLLRRDAGGGRDRQSARLPPHVQLVGFSLGSVAT